jgi:TatD DNase family protein
MRDIGANLTGKPFHADIGEVITRAQEAGVKFIDVTGTDTLSSERAAQLAQAYPHTLGSTAGIHPHAAKTCDPANLAKIRHLLAAPHVLMCGEMGLDFARNYSTPHEQRNAFESQLDIAQEIGKPLFLHCRDAFDEFLAIMDKRPQLWKRSIVHCFTGNKKEATALMERGAFIGLTGWITDKRRNTSVLEAIKSYPLDKIMIETDAPYLMPLNMPKSQLRDRNEPAHLIWVARALAKSIGRDEEEVMKTTYMNAESLIGRPPASEPSKHPKP